MVNRDAGDRPLVALTARRLADGRVKGWTTGGAGELGKYLDAVRRAGGWPVLLGPAPLDEREAAALLGRFDALVLTGGPDVEPQRFGEESHETVYGTDALVDDFEVALVRAARSVGLPLLAICRGIQVLNVAFGGTLHQHIPDHPGVAPHGTPGVKGGEYLHEPAVEAGSLLAEALGTELPTCSCHHHQAVALLGEGLRVSARAADGIVEGLEADDDSGGWVLAVQWHPEDTAAEDPAQQGLFDALVQRAHPAV